MTEENPTTESINTDEMQTPIDPQIEAEKAAIIATGNYHLTSLYNAKVNETHAKVANLVAEIMKATERTTSWTQAEVVAIWDRVENELKAAL